MVFDPKTWADGELITAGDLNRVEQAVDAVDEQMGAKVDTTDPRLSDARPPTTHTHPTTDVDGLKAIIDRLTYDSGWRDIGSLLINGWSAYAYPTLLRRVGSTCELRAYLNKSNATSNLFLATVNGFRPNTATNTVGAAYGTVATTTVAFIQNGTGFSLQTSRMPQSQMMVSMVWTTADPIPSTLPGTPA